MRRRPMRPRVWRRLFRWHRGRWARWLWMGPAMLVLFNTASYKLHADDIERVEQNTGKAATNLSEEELVLAMRKLGIKSLELTDEDQDAILGTL